MKKITVLILTTLTVLTLVSALTASRAAAYSRGPYLPQDQDLVLPGSLLAREGLNERCEDRREPCDPYSEYVLTQNPAGFEFGSVKYECEEIDDGAYGALSCRQNGYVTISTHTTCTSDPAASGSSGNLYFRDWLCTK